MRAAILAVAVAGAGLVPGLVGCGREPEVGPVRPTPGGAIKSAEVEPPEAVHVVEGVERGGVWFPAEQMIADHVATLADPALRGRGGGTADEAAAADKMAAWFREAGLEPGGADGGWKQSFLIGGEVKSQNVIGVVRGRDPRAGHVIIGAHYDHLGVDAAGAIYPGADDNASGAAALVAIGHALTRDGQRPTRTVIIVAFGAEEIGLLGSSYYAHNPVRPLGEAALMINLDMIGRAEFLSAQAYAPARMLVPRDGIGALTSVDGRDLAMLAKRAGELEARPVVAASDYGALEGLIRPTIEYRGDHKSFADAGVRYLWLSTSMHDDYHLPSDTPDKVDPATVATVGRIVVRVVQTLP